MEPITEGLKSPEVEETRVNVNITLNITPFGHWEIKDSFRLNLELEQPTREPSATDEYAFPEGTFSSHRILSPAPFVIITH